MKDTLRLILFLECNMSCSYCCNNIKKIRSRFVEKSFSEIDLNKYSNVCITGGEPFLDKRLLYIVLNSIPEFKNVYIYTNGLLINWEDVHLLRKLGNIKGINIGLHTTQQLKKIIHLEKYLPVRFMMQNTKRTQFLKTYPERLNKNNIHPWELNQCEMPNEDWILLEGE